MNYIQTLLPFMVAAGLSISKGAFLIAAFTVTSSLLQPAFGYLVDQKNQRWMVYTGTLWTAVLLSLVGVLQTYPLLVLMVSLAGMGTAAFHPQASAMIDSISGNRKGFFQSVFMAAGNIGWALTPLMVVPFIQTYGLSLTPLFVLPGVLVAALVWFTAPGVTPDTVKKEAPPPLWPTLRAVWPDLLRVMLVITCRSMAYFGLVSFLPLYLQHNNVSLLTSSRLLFLMLFSGALGGLLGGYLSDLFGRKTVIVGSLCLAGPLFYLFLNTHGFFSYLLLALAGGCLMASFSVTVVTAQEIISKNAAMAAGLMLGFGVGIGGLGVGLIGLLAESMGIVHTIHWLIWLPLLAGLFGLGLKGRKATAQQLPLSS